jgi:hypothetical protein
VDAAFIDPRIALKRLVKLAEMLANDLGERPEAGALREAATRLTEQRRAARTHFDELTARRDGDLVLARVYARTLRRLLAAVQSPFDEEWLAERFRPGQTRDPGTEHRTAQFIVDRIGNAELALAFRVVDALSQSRPSPSAGMGSLEQSLDRLLAATVLAAFAMGTNQDEVALACGIQQVTHLAMVVRRLVPPDEPGIEPLAQFRKQTIGLFIVTLAEMFQAELPELLGVNAAVQEIGALARGLAGLPASPADATRLEILDAVAALTPPQA